MLAVMLFVIAAGLQGLLPHPRAGTNLGLWTWFGYDFGVVKVSTSQTEYQREIRWASRTLRAESWKRADPALGQPPVRRWWTARHGPDQFELSVEVPHVRSRDVVGAIGSVVYDEMLGVRIGPDVPGGNLTPFRVRGTKAEVLSEVIRQFSIDVTPFKFTDDQTHVWAWDDDRDMLTYMTLQAAEDRGYAPIETRPVFRRSKGRPFRAIKPPGFMEPPRVEVPAGTDLSEFVGPPAT